MARFATIFAAAVALPHALGAQSSIAARVAAAPDGEVRMTYATRAKACGDGKDVIAIGKALNVYSSIESYGRWSGVTCVPGPARVSVSVRDHQIVAIRPHVGGTWKPGDGVTDLGRVSAREAAAYFLSLVPQLGAPPRSRMNPLLPAALADSADITPDLLRFARDASLSRETHRRAVHWVGVVGDASVVAPLVALARGEGDASTNADDPGPGDGLQSAATGALAMLDDGVGLEALRDIARHGPVSARKAAVFWLGQSDDLPSRALVRTVIEDDRETEAVRGAAIFALGQGETTAADLKFLQDVYKRLPSDRLKDRVLMAMSQGDSEDGARWLIAQARDEQQSVEVRKKAVFWAGQGHARLSDITSLYQTVREARLREHIIFVLSQRNEDAATDALLDIARTDEDRAMRKKALFWLTQKNDPRVSKLISDLVLR